MSDLEALNDTTEWFLTNNRSWECWVAPNATSLIHNSLRYSTNRVAKC